MQPSETSTLALLISSSAAFALPTDIGGRFLAKLKTAALDQIVAKATITMMQDGKPKSL
jgi:hypothetical protein